MLIDQLKKNYKAELRIAEKEFPLTVQHLIEVLSTEEYITSLTYGDIMDMQSMMKGNRNPFTYFDLDLF
tara:strand:- start:195 stop:401 length:207 start_codon:yes stop_codon:yes gene_type:complete